MKTGIIVALTCMGMVSPNVQAAMETYEEGLFIETKLCATGRIIRIPLGGGEDEMPDHARACHALCSRDADSDEDDCQSSDKG